MISEKDQRGFLEFARPPSGMRLSYCIGTTFTLDFSALVQLGLNTQGISEDVKVVGLPDAFKALHEFEKRSLIVCQTCRIQKIPKELFEKKKTPRQRLLSLLDSAIMSVPTSDKLKTFHPKVYLLKFDRKEGKGQPVWKLLVTSRNLTESKSWEIGVELLGTKMTKRVQANSELTSFFKAVKDFCRDTNKRKLLDDVLKDLPNISFSLPAPFTELVFDYRNGVTSPFKVLDPNLYSEIIALSPFLDKTALKSLDRISKSLLISSTKDISRLDGFPELMENSYRFRLEGYELHAKMYLCRHKTGGGTSVFIGSPNLTTAGLLGGGNFEFLIKLQSRNDLIADFKRSFIFQKMKSRQPFPWLLKVNADDLEASRSELEKENQRKVLDEVRDSLSQGTFVIKKAGKLSWHVQWRGPKVDWPKHIEGKISFSDGGESHSLRAIVEGREVVTIKSKSPSALLWIKLATAGLPILEFGSVAEVIGNRGARSDDVIDSISECTSLADMLRAFLRDSGTGLALPPEEGGLPKGLRKVKNHRGGMQIDGYVEALLLSDLESPIHRDIISKTIDSFFKRGQSETIELKRFWSELVSAIEERSKNVA